MVKLSSWLLILALGIGAASWTAAQSGDAKKPLDLPSGGRGDDEDEEDAPETITFYGGEYEGDGFFWCLDKSCSMGWADDLGQLQNEMTQSIAELSENSQFSMVAFSDGYIVWSNTPKDANVGNRASANAWVLSLTADGNTCLAPAAVQTITISNLCHKDNKQILILSDGVPNCPGPAETLSVVTTANWQHTPINTIYIASDNAGITFMQQLAAMNGGTFYQPPPG